MSRKSTGSRDSERPHYAERLRVPIAWWVLASLFAGSLWLAYIAVLEPVVAHLAGLAVFALVGVVLVRYGRAPIKVGDGSLVVADRAVPLTQVKSVAALDQDMTRRMRGPQATPDLHLVIRPYMSRSVLIRLTEPDEHGSNAWLVATRHPLRLADALQPVSAR